MANYLEVVLLSVCVLGASCSVAPQPKSAKTIAAFEIPLPTEGKRREFLELLGTEAEAEGLHVDFASERALKQRAIDSPAASMTIHAAIWRGDNDNQSEAVIMDGAGHLGRAWLVFSRGKDEKLAARFRNRVMPLVRARWSETLSLPIMPSGAIPLHKDLIKTPDGYKVDPTAASKYVLEQAESKRAPEAP